MVGGTFHMWRQICLVQHALWSEIWQICRLRVFVCQFLVSITRFWEAHFCSKLVVGGKKHLKRQGPFGQELFVDQQMYECEKEVESLV